MSGRGCTIVSLGIELIARDESVIVLLTTHHSLIVPSDKHAGPCSSHSQNLSRRAQTHYFCHSRLITLPSLRVAGHATIHLSCRQLYVYSDYGLSSTAPVSAAFRPSPRHVDTGAYEC